MFTPNQTQVMANRLPYQHVQQPPTIPSHFFIQEQPAKNSQPLLWRNSVPSENSHAPISPANGSSSEKQMKSVNNWMAFRSYYIQLFPGMQQKQRSTYVLEMWTAEPFKAKWAVIAKAYSSIRNHVGKDRAPLDVYLKIVCPKMGVIEPGEYFKVMGWTLSHHVNGSTLFQQVTTQSLSAYSNSTISDKELIIYCAEMDYILRHTALQITGARTTMMSAPSLPPEQQDLFASASPALMDTVKHPKAVPAIPSENVPIGPSRLVTNSIATMQPSTFDQAEYQWTGSMADLYNPAEGSVDYFNLLQGPQPNYWQPQNQNAKTPEYGMDYSSSRDILLRAYEQEVETRIQEDHAIL